MEIGSREWQNLIIDSARQLDIVVDERICAAFATHSTELIRWNRKINLTTITDPRDIAIKHFLDSLAPSRFVQDRARLLDIGSGGGFPGIPLKVLKPSLSLLLIDGIRKKVNFLKHVLRKLRLDQSEALQMRAEKLREDPKYAHSFDIIISRALSDLTAFVNCTLPLLAKQGTIFGMKGKVDQKELDALRAEILGDRFSLEVKKYILPSIHAQRSIIIIKHLK